MAHREVHGPFPSRSALLEVKGIGPKNYLLAAGFLRVTAVDADPLDGTEVHPESYDAAR